MQRDLTALTTARACMHWIMYLSTGLCVSLGLKASVGSRAREAGLQYSVIYTHFLQANW